MRLPPVGNGGGAFTYAGSNKPQDAVEGETWYDSANDRVLVFVDDAGTTKRMDVGDHSALSGVSVGQHRSDQNIRQTVDGQVDAETVDGQHASDLGTAAIEHSGSGAEYFGSPPAYTSGGSNSKSTSETLFNAGGTPLVLYVYLEATAEKSGGEYSDDRANTTVRLYAQHPDGSETQIEAVGATVSANTNGPNTSTLRQSIYTANWSMKREISGIYATADYTFSRSNSGDSPNWADYSAKARATVLG